MEHSEKMFMDYKFNVKQLRLQIDLARLGQVPWNFVLNLV